MKIHYHQFILSDEHSESSDGIPVLVDTETGDVYGPDDLCKPWGIWGYRPAKVHMKRMAEQLSLSEEDREFVERFTGSTPR